MIFLKDAEMITIFYSISVKTGCFENNNILETYPIRNGPVMSIAGKMNN